MPEPALMSAWSSENIDQVSDAGVPNDSALPLDRMPKEEDYEPSMLSKAILSLQEYKQESPLNTGRYSEPKAERPGIRNMAQSAYARVLDDFVGDPYLTDSTARNAQVSARRPSSRRQVDYDRMMYKGQITYRPGTDVLRTSTTEPDELNWDAVSHTASFILHGIQEWVTNNGIDEMGEEYRYPVAYPASRCQTPVSVGVLRKVASVWDSVKPNMTLASLLNQGRHAPEDPPKTVRSDDHYWTRGTSDVEYLSNDSSEGELDYLGCLDLGCEGHKKKLAGCLSTGGEFLRELSPKNIRRFGAPERLTSVPEDRPLSQNAFPLIPPMTRCPPSHPPRNSTRMPQSMPPVLVDEHTLRRASRSHVYLELRAFQNLEVVQEVSLTMGQFCYKGSSFSILRIPMKSADLRRELLVLHMTICTTTESRHPLTLHGVLPLETPMDSTSCTSYEKWIPFMKAPIKDVEQLDFHDICSYQDRAVNQASALVFVRIFIVLSGLIEVPSAMGDMCTVYVADIRDPLDIEVANFCLENPSAVGCIMRCGPPGEYLVNGQICQVFERSSSLWVREGGAQLLLTDYLNGLTSSIEWVPLVSSAAPELMEPVFLPDNTPWECKQDPSKALELAMYRESVRKALLAWQTGDTLVSSEMVLQAARRGFRCAATSLFYHGRRRSAEPSGLRMVFASVQ
ncbi:MAG: uncharacterized protein KVP18_000801 [Porospora cf. gigantea A]|uniref:uncharacterized protein n=1 Tax=Porospora cf. gigantea A TaxID=2853593 RepID=UPI00355A66F9|nr:MAG: hypothetical protein KVP18_000801 [Porospora cf. gigantea A]